MSRIFVAILISESLQKRILQWENKPLLTSPSAKGRNIAVPPSLQKRGLGGVRWVAGKNLHITLVPPWEKSNVEAVIVKLKTVSSQPFEINFEKISFGPNSREPRMIWASGPATKEITDLRLRIYDALEQKPKDRDFRLHITLARFRPNDFIKFPIQHLNEKIDWHEQVKFFALMESHLSSAGADYEILSEVILNGV